MEDGCICNGNEDDTIDGDDDNDNDDDDDDNPAFLLIIYEIQFKTFCDEYSCTL